jgi:RNA polymerase sigma-54 factor
VAQKLYYGGTEVALSRVSEEQPTLAATATLEMTPQLAMRASPALLAFVEMLVLSAPALDDLVERELADNPALERVEFLGQPGQIEDVPSASSAREELLADVMLTLPENDRLVAEYVVDSLDDRGFLDLDDEELARTAGVAVGVVRRVLQAVRDAGPPGVAAHDVRESLLLQIERIEGDPIVELARRIVECHLADLAHGRDDAIAATLGVPRPDVDAARVFVRTRLRPYVDLGPRTRAATIASDVAVAERPDEPGAYDVELVENERYGLALSPLYARLADDGDALSEEERARVVAQVAQARAFIARVDRRRATLQRVAELVVARQHAFVRHGSAALVPLTRADVARELGLHESTVCRAVSGRYVRLPSGRVVAFADFFRRSLGAEETLVRLVAEEDHPRSDAELAHELAACGFRVARRTVAKYRGRLGILPYVLR